MKRVCVFCGSNVGADPDFRRGAEALGQELLDRGIGLVFGGGSVGLMGVIADAVLAGSGEVIGVIPRALSAKEIAHQGVTEMIVVSGMHPRKAKMAELSDAFIAMPGGYGTLEELFEVITWAQLGFHRKPIGILNLRGFFDPLLKFMDQMVEQGFVKPEYRELVVVADDPRKLLERVMTHRMPAVERWIEERRET